MLTLLLGQKLVTDWFSKVEFNCVVFNELSDGLPWIIDFGKLYQQRNQVIELSILHVIIPRYDWDSLLWLQHISWWRVIQNNGICCPSAYLWHVFGKDSIHISAVFSEKSHGAESISVHLVHQGVSVFWQTCCEYDELEIIWHNLEEIVDSWSLLDINAANVSFYVDRYYIVRVLNLIELTVYKSFI